MSLTGKNALVTGASRGIGRAVAVELARQGAKVFCLSTREGGCDETVAACADAGSESGGSAEALACNVADPEQVKASADHILANGGLYALVNNAGITRDGLLMRMPAEDFDAVIDVNLRGVFLLCKAFSRSLVKAKGARIVNVTSVVGLTGNAGQANYAASKAGVIGFTKSLAREFGGRGVTVNALAPGFIETDMTSELPENVKAEAMKAIPLGRFGASQDIANAVAFLCSDSAAYITGQVLVVDGGMTM